MNKGDIVQKEKINGMQQLGGSYSCLIIQVHGYSEMYDEVLDVNGDWHVSFGIKQVMLQYGYGFKVENIALRKKTSMIFMVDELD